MMADVLGVDMSIAATTIMSPGLTALADADAWAGQTVVVVGRYLGDGHGVATPLDAKEPGWLHGQGRSIALIYNMATSTSVAGGWAAGVADATDALTRAAAIGAPAGAGVVIWLDCEYGWPIGADYIKAWCETILQGGFVPGIYGSLGSAEFIAAWQAALAADAGNVGRCQLWSANWVSTGASAAAAPAWAPQRPGPGGPAPTMWQFTGSTFGGIVDEDEVDTALLASGLWKAPPSSVPASTPPAPAAASELPQGPTAPAPPMDTPAASVDWQARALAAEGRLAAIKTAGGW